MIAGVDFPGSEGTCVVAPVSSTLAGVGSRMMTAGDVIGALACPGLWKIEGGVLGVTGGLSTVAGVDGGTGTRSGVTGFLDFTFFGDGFGGDGWGFGGDGFGS